MANDSLMTNFIFYFETTLASMSPVSEGVAHVGHWAKVQVHKRRARRQRRKGEGVE
jgi:hypothetical protein